MGVIKNLSLAEIIALGAPGYAFGASMNFPANQTTNIDTAIPVKFALLGAEYWVNSAHLSTDYFDGHLYDKDDVLGGGATSVIQFVNKNRMRPDTLHTMRFDFPLVITTTGLYFRFAYTNSQAVIATAGFVNFFGYNLDGLA